MKTPLPVRIAAGLVATAVEQARELPRLVVEFPVTAVSQALQASMRVQQRVTELAIKGDRILGALRPAQERPSWATFDDDDDEPRRNGSSSVTALRPQTARPTPARVAEPRVPIGPELPIEPQVRAEAQEPAEHPLPIGPAMPVRTAADVAARTTAVAVESQDTGPALDGAAGPDVMPGYQDLTIPQLRGKLRHLDVSDLHALLEWETARGNRPPYVTMLTNRITTVTES